MKPNPQKSHPKPVSEVAMPKQTNAPPRPPLTQGQSANRIPATLITGGACLSIPGSNQLGQRILGTTPLVQVSRIGSVSGAQPISSPVVGHKTQIQLPKLKGEQTMHTVIGQSDNPVTSSAHITHLLSSNSLVTPLGPHVNLGQAPQRVTIQAMGQAQNPSSTQPVALTLTQASTTQTTIGHQHVGLVSNQMASIICSNKPPRLTSQPTQLLQAFPSSIPRAGVQASGKAIRVTSHTSTPQQTAVLPHFSTRGPVITPIRTATISNRPNSPAAPPPAGLSITVPSAQLTEQHQKFRALSATPGMEINLQTSRSLHDSRPVISQSGTKTIHLSHNTSGQKIVMATTAIPAGGSHASITVAITKPITSQIVASALLPSNVTTVTTASITPSQAIPIAKVTPQRFTQITQQPQPQQQSASQHHQQPAPQPQQPPQHDQPASTLYVPPRSSGTSAVDGGKPESRSVGQMIQYSFGTPYDQHHYAMGGHFQLGATGQTAGAGRPTLVTAQPAITVGSGSASLSLQGGASPLVQNQARGNPVVVMDPSRQIQVRNAANSVTGALQTVHIPMQQTQLQPSSPAHVPQSPSSGAPSASPRPSILRKRTHDGYPVISKKALPFSVDSSRQEQVSSPKQTIAMESQHRETSQSSTDTASSQDGSTNSTPTAHDIKVKMENPDEEPLPSLLLRDGTSSVEASPRKKPRKQLLQASQELKDEVVNSTTSEEDEQTQQPEESEIKEEMKDDFKDEHVDEEGVRWVTTRKRPDFTLMNHYSCTWKTKNNHFVRYSDVRPKDERRPTVNELSNQKHIQQKSSGWKLFHLAAQLDDLMTLEAEVKDKMMALQAELAPDSHRGQYGSVVDEAVMVHELTQANIQRSQLIVDQMNEAKQSMLSILDHKKKIDEIVNKHRSRRPVKSKARM